MRKFYSFLLTSLTGLLPLYAQYSNGLIVSNEGNIGVSNAEISYIENNVITNNIYGTANAGETLGDVLQSITFHDQKGLLVLNNSNKVVVVNRESFVKEATITENIYQPRYSTVLHGKIYTTNTAYGQPSYVSVHDATTYQWITNIALNQSSEEIYAVGNHVYVMGAWYGEGNRIDVIDPTTNAITTSLTLEQGLQSLEVNGTDVYALTSNATGTTVYKVNGLTHQIVSEVKNTSLRDVTKFSLGASYLYLKSGLNVYRVPQDLTNFPSEVFFTGRGTDSWGSGFYGFDVIDDSIYQLNANEYVSATSVHQYSLTGDYVQTLTAGLIGNHIYKNYYENLATDDVVVTTKPTVYPNPTRDYIYVATTNEKAIHYQLMDFTGRVVAQGQYNGGIKVNQLGKGTYLLQLTIGNKRSTHSIIKK